MPIPIRLAACHAAWRRARRGKQPSVNQLAFEVRWLDNLLDLTTTLRAGAWQPARTVSFMVTHPKTREIHAPDFADRVVHHILVERLEKIYEPVFIHDSFANRRGRGHHAAADRLQTFLRQRENMPGQNPHGGWYLQLDIHNYFNSIHRPTLYTLLCRRLAQARVGKRGSCPRGITRDETVGNQTCPPRQLAEGSHSCGSGGSTSPARGTPVDTPLLRGDPPAGSPRTGFNRDCPLGIWVQGNSSGFKAIRELPLRLPNKSVGAIHESPTIPSNGQSRFKYQQKQLKESHALALRSLCHKLLHRKSPELVRDAAAAAAVPPHKRLCNAAPGCGLPVGNLTSQFFANVYLNELDQFIKHTLKVRHYVRYVDDFVLLGQSRQELLDWQAQIEAFLQGHLRLKLKQRPILQPCSQGIDFLGYRIFAHHRLVRPRVVRHCRSRIELWHQKHPRFDRVGPDDVAQLQALLGSYWGHFAHADSVRLRQSLFARHHWLHEYFSLQKEGGLKINMPARWHVLRHHAVRKILNRDCPLDQNPSQPPLAPARGTPECAPLLRNDPSAVRGGAGSALPLARGSWRGFRCIAG